MNGSRRADADTLLRRVAYDLTGLPPTRAELAAFRADRSPGAYARAVDALLAKPQFAERMASDWMDYSRYADSYGFQVDRDREVWPWRDWVISAFDRNMPFDRFVTWQLAGDLLPGASEEQVLATAFNRLHRQESEGGSVEEEYRMECVADRVQTFASMFLGLTFECARCHDHKFDPVTQEDYYALAGIFRSTRHLADEKLGAIKFWYEHSLATSEEVTAKRTFDARVKTLQANVAKTVEDARGALRKELDARVS